MSFVGNVKLGDTLPVPIQVKAANGVPANASSIVARVFGPSGEVILESITPTFMDTKSIGDVNTTSGNLFTVTSTGHGLSTGMYVTIENVAGWGDGTDVNDDWLITKVNDNSFTLNGSSGDGTHSATDSTGTWKVTGLYKASVAATGANGFERGKTYTILATAVLAGGEVVSGHDSFVVV